MREHAFVAAHGFGKSAGARRRHEQQQRGQRVRLNLRRRGGSGRPACRKLRLETGTMAATGHNSGARDASFIERVENLIAERTEICGFTDTYAVVIK